MPRKPQISLASANALQAGPPHPQQALTQLKRENGILRGLARRYRRAAIAVIIAGEVKAVVVLATAEPGSVEWLANAAWGAALLLVGGSLVAPHVKRILELGDPTRPQA
ncbi:hypothetical protein ACFFX1_10490 [Dactylosporangium sucinum]|uniref:Uncharacterized protein n=1 Tax=Dactylosporangium sucinum TaxID=1424081 RepID=A0A917THJ5_9ACTN|nr:hypothetical protein [Dactylosporangium sucinum]GGM23531.1 hypothetical protein GCM10007977_025910 [Dactylosporangium sucinum]